MGREIKRVALDFDYPINAMIWKGYHNPYRSLECKTCDGSGYSLEAKQLADDWYDTAGTGKKWCYSITQDEVHALVKGGRLMVFTHTWEKGNGWEKKEPAYMPTADEVNVWAQRGFGHDAINRCICVETRASRMGIELLCQTCAGTGTLWPEDKYEKLWEEWEPIEPPTGDGYQLWSTTSEGTPMSPVFETPEELARWLSDNNASTLGSDTAPYDQWLAFIKGPGWSVSMVKADRGFESGVAHAVRLAGEEV